VAVIKKRKRGALEKRSVFCKTVSRSRLSRFPGQGKLQPGLFITTAQKIFYNHTIKFFIGRAGSRAAISPEKR
jgi:hypothetical protein